MRHTLSRGRRAKAAAIAVAGTPIIAALGRTYHWHEAGTEHLDRIRAEGRQPIYALWHGRIMPGILYLRDRGIVVILDSRVTQKRYGKLFLDALPECKRGKTRTRMEDGG